MNEKRFSKYQIDGGREWDGAAINIFGGTATDILKDQGSAEQQQSKMNIEGDAGM